MENTFKRNLLLGFGASLLILIITSVASYVSISNLLSSARLVNSTNEVISQMHEVLEGLLNAETGQRGYILALEDEFLAPYLNSRETVMESFRKLELMTQEAEHHKENLAKLEGLINKRFDYLQVSIADAQAGHPVSKENLREGREIMAGVRETIDAMQLREQQLLAQRTETMNRFSSYTPPLIVIAALLALLITVLFYVKVRSDFEVRLKLQNQLLEKDKEMSNRIGIIREIAEKISDGNYEIRVSDAQTDALGSVAGSLNKMASSLQSSFNLLSDKEWLQTGLSGLNDEMIGDKTLEGLTQDVVNFVATYTNSQVAAIYILHDDTLRGVAGYALDRDKLRTGQKIGEGLVGQAVSAGKLLELRDIPAENIIISFTSGSAKPKHVAAMPIFDGRKVKGAIELASIHEFTERDLEFIKTAVHNIGIAITTAQNRKRLQELLEETQAQSEELQAQHNELENINAELEVQAEKLQASEEELKVQQEELKQANEELEERSRLLEERNQVISERNIEIQLKADQLAQTTRYKSEFLANMSHELRTPLNSILLLSRLMYENQENNLTPDQIEYARVIQSSGNGLLSLIDEILDLSKIEAGKMELEYQRVPVKEIVDSMRALFNPMATEKNIEFRTAIASDVPEIIETDKMRLEQIVRNLVSNAIKFTSVGYVSLHVHRDHSDSQYIRITIKDTGIGIPKDKHAQVFEAFRQADGSTRRKFGGTGLGLSISKELVKLLGGDITLTSEQDQGSEFSLLIPVSREVRIKSVQAKEEKIIEAPPIIKSLPEPERKFISTFIPEDVPDDRNQIQEGDKVILIVEDDANFAKSLLDYTRKKGYKGIVSVRGDEGVELAKQFLPAGVLLDIQLPVKSGWEVMEELKNTPQTRHIPVHIMSSYEVKNESLSKGAVNFINKPVAFEQMQDVFQKIEYVLTHHPKKVLIVEENAKHAKALAYFLETYDLSLDITNQVDNAITSLKNDLVDCVILDMGIPDQKSYDVLESLKKTPGLEHIPIIIFTGKSLSHAEEVKIKQYADSIVVKTAHSYKRMLDEVSLFLHLMERDKSQETELKRPHKLGSLQDVLKNKTVLVADDDMRNIFSLTKALEKYKMNVVAAVDGKDALQKLKENPSVDVVLMDMMMPEMDGYESTAAIRKIPKYKNLPIIAVTAKAMMGDRAKCLNAGASDYITKPVDVDQLFSLLRVWLYERG